MLGRLERPDRQAAIAARHPTLGDRYVYAGGDPTWLFTENETNTQRIFGTPGPHRWVKDGINDYVVHDRRDAVNPAQVGTKPRTTGSSSRPGGRSRSACA